MSELPTSDQTRPEASVGNADARPHISILGIRGLPAAHGGFETFAERLAPFLRDRNWRVTVYCQASGSGAPWVDDWQGIRRVHIPVRGDGPASTMQFDWRCILHAARERTVCLTLGYNTALFCLWLRLRGVHNVINMDGVEWRRAKWSMPARAWFWLNDWAGCWLGNRLVADHPEIAKHLSTRTSSAKITTIAYGADAILDAPTDCLSRWGLEAGNYFTLIARPEPENSILEIVSGFSSKSRGRKLLVLGNYQLDSAYHDAVRQAASEEVIFAGAIYDQTTLRTLRYHCLAYFHGHRVGGTNPSLVEAMGAGNLVIAHDNAYNRWVSGVGAYYFQSSDEVSTIIDLVLARPEEAASRRALIRQRHHDEFRWEPILDSYSTLLFKHATTVRSGIHPTPSADLKH